ncbi:MAG: metal ABC transporter permease [Phycisphaerales bacterium]|nr:MAG: metal ABC transporter permease [Phycisphaerales bacterium]
MIRFFQDMPANPFLITGLLAGVLSGLACGFIGPYVITRRMVFLAGAIAHIAVGGIGAAIFIQYHLRRRLGEGADAMDLAALYEQHPLFARLDPLLPTLGAFAAALAGAVLIGLVHQRVRERIDTLVGAMWAVGMAIGVLLIKFTPGYHTELMSYLFGNIAFVPWSEIRLMLLLNAIILVVVLLLHKRLLAVCLDEQHARLSGINVPTVNIVLLCLVALTVICLIRVVGLILVLALLTLPAATAGHHLRRLAPMMLASSVLCILLATVPRIAVYGTRLSPEAAIVLAAAAVYLLSVLLSRRRAGSRSSARPHRAEGRILKQSES